MAKSMQSHVAREQWPIPDAKDPNTEYPPITTLRPPNGAPQRPDRAH